MQSNGVDVPGAHIVDGQFVEFTAQNLPSGSLWNLQVRYPAPCESIAICFTPLLMTALSSSGESSVHRQRTKTHQKFRQLPLPGRGEGWGCPVLAQQRDR